MFYKNCYYYYMLVAVIAAEVAYGQAQYYYRNRYDKETSAEEENHQDLSKIPGEAGVDYPLYHQVPETGFSCNSVPFAPGMYANVETGCQAYHVCHDGREGHQGAAFLCANGTVFNQEAFACDWWYNVDCKRATDHYRLNGDPDRNPFAGPRPKKSQEEDEYDYDKRVYKKPVYYKTEYNDRLDPDLRNHFIRPIYPQSKSFSSNRDPPTLYVNPYSLPNSNPYEDPNSSAEFEGQQQSREGSSERLHPTTFY